MAELKEAARSLSIATMDLINSMTPRTSKSMAVQADEKGVVLKMQTSPDNANIESANRDTFERDSIKGKLKEIRYDKVEEVGMQRMELLDSECNYNPETQGMHSPGSSADFYSFSTVNHSFSRTSSKKPASIASTDTQKYAPPKTFVSRQSSNIIEKHDVFGRRATTSHFDETRPFEIKKVRSKHDKSNVGLGAYNFNTSAQNKSMTESKIDLGDTYSGFKTIQSKVADLDELMAELKQCTKEINEISPLDNNSNIDLATMRERNQELEAMVRHLTLRHANEKEKTEIRTNRLVVLANEWKKISFDLQTRLKTAEKLLAETKRKSEVVTETKLKNTRTGANNSDGLVNDLETNTEIPKAKAEIYGNSRKYFAALITKVKNASLSLPLFDCQDDWPFIKNFQTLYLEMVDEFHLLEAPALMKQLLLSRFGSKAILWYNQKKSTMGDADALHWLTRIGDDFGLVKVVQKKSQYFEEYLSEFQKFYSYNTFGKGDLLLKGLNLALKKDTEAYLDDVHSKLSFHEMVLLIRKIESAKSIFISRVKGKTKPFQEQLAFRNYRE